MSHAPERLYPLNRPAGHVPPIPRYSSWFPHAPDQLAVLFVGVQARQWELAHGALQSCLSLATEGVDASCYVDLAVFVDQAGATNHIAALYWPDRASFERWAARAEVTTWRAGSRALREGFGQWWEPVSVAPDRAETITFSEYRRGLSACPFSRLQSIGETGYWGAARDRIPASGYDRLDSTVDTLAFLKPRTRSLGRRLAIRPPSGLTVIRSGVSWAACGPEQRESFERNVRPKLDAGMEHLRRHPIESGCCLLRQVMLTDPMATQLPEAYSLGHFLSLSHLEAWAKHHPTHLAIYNRALAERRKYQERLELRTYNEIYVLDASALPFEYVNCHDATGLIPFFPGEAID